MDKSKWRGRYLQYVGMTYTDGLHVHSEEILILMDEILPSGSSLTDLPYDLMNNLALTDKDLNENIIPDKPMNDQLKGEEEFMDNQVRKISN